MTNQVKTIGDLAKIPLDERYIGMSRLVSSTNTVFRIDTDIHNWEEVSAQSITNTDALAEGKTNLYFTASKLWNTVLTGLASAANAAIGATDTLLAALAKLQAQINNKLNIGEALALTQQQKDSLATGQNYFISAIKNAQTGEVYIDPTIQSIDVFATELVDDSLIDPNGWGNAPGKNSEYKILTGLNTDNQLGSTAQRRIIGGITYECIQHANGTDATNGTATWYRNRAINFLNPNNTDNPFNTSDTAIANALAIEAGWDDTSNTKTLPLALACTPGVAWRPTTGYLYICIDQHTWAREVGTPDYQPMAITTITHPVLTSRLAAFNFAANGDYLQAADDETSYQDQEYWGTGTPTYLYRKGMNNNWRRILTNN